MHLFVKRPVPEWLGYSAWSFHHIILNMIMINDPVIRQQKPAILNDCGLYLCLPICFEHPIKQPLLVRPAVFGAGY
ncbi:MAG: hypothetical protein EA394_04470 [Bacteroidia bacterium]|nr:MAG: hypothetical protein EA394_04470 [Bacteroidia bacterium]